MNSDENNEKFATSDKKIQELTEISQKYSKIISDVMLETQKNIIGQEDIIKKILISIISDGHVLLESVPGLAKTLMIKTMAEIFSVNSVRIQFTPDLLPADILGTKIYKNNSNSFEIQKGPIFHNFVLADEINRAPPKVQSALLESMQEKQVSIHGETFQLEKPFLVLATQNPIENEGTYKLPEAQVDRFALKILIDYPSKQEELEIIESNSSEQENKIKGYVLDVRSNPGGLLTQAVKVTDIFLERGEIVSTRGRDKKDIRRYRAKKSDRTNGKPLVVIIDGGSASASEIVAGALQDHKRAIIIGTQSFGKGSVQTIIPFQVSNSDNLTGIRLTTARYYTPSGESIQGKGIVPDIIIEQGEFESFNYKRFSESDLKDSLDKNNEEELEDNEDNELSEFEKRLELDYQLRRAFDLVQGVSLFNEIQE